MNKILTVRCAVDCSAKTLTDNYFDWAAYILLLVFWQNRANIYTNSVSLEYLKIVPLANSCKIIQFKEIFWVLSIIAWMTLNGQFNQM